MSGHHEYGDVMTKGDPGSRAHTEIEKFLASAPIYYQPWWLEAVSPGNWDYAIVRRGTDIAAVMPFVRRAYGRAGIALGMPDMTFTLGPWMRLSEMDQSKQFTEHVDLMAELIDALPPHASFQQNFHYTVTNWLPFHWRGFSQTTGYTYVLDDLRDLDAVWAGFDPDIRWNIGKAGKSVRVVDDLGIETFNEVRVKSFARQGKESVWSLDFIRRVDKACELHDARKILFAIDSNNRIHAVAYIIWTEYAAYHAMGGGDPALRDSGANFLLIWEAIRYVRDVAKRFDFEMDLASETIEHFCRLFGGKLMPYFRVGRDLRSLPGRAWSGWRHLARRFRARSWVPRLEVSRRMSARP